LWVKYPSTPETSEPCSDGASAQQYNHTDDTYGKQLRNYLTESSMQGKDSERGPLFKKGITKSANRFSPHQSVAFSVTKSVRSSRIIATQTQRTKRHISRSLQWLRHRQEKMLHHPAYCVYGFLSIRWLRMHSPMDSIIYQGIPSPQLRITFQEDVSWPMLGHYSPYVISVADLEPKPRGGESDYPHVFYGHFFTLICMQIFLIKIQTKLDVYVKKKNTRFFKQILGLKLPICCLLLHTLCLFKLSTRCFFYIASLNKFVTYEHWINKLRILHIRA
jgi:hypothetical protein